MATNIYMSEEQEGVSQEGDHMVKTVPHKHIHSFLREAAALVLLKKAGLPNIVELISIEPGKIIMAKYDSDLDECAHSIDCSLLAYQVLTILHHLEMLGIVHRDIKPDNILIKHNDPQSVALCDFDLSRYTDTGVLEHCSNSIQTRRYRSPEVLFGSTINPTTLDVWSLGVMLLDTITDICPDTAECDLVSAEAEYHRLFDGDQFPATEHSYMVQTCKAIGINPAFPTIIKQMLTFNPFQRPDPSTLISNEYFDPYRNRDQEVKTAQQIVRFNETRALACELLITCFIRGIRPHNREDICVLSSYEYDNEETLLLAVYLYCKLCQVLDTDSELSEDQLVTIIGIVVAISDHTVFNDMVPQYVHEITEALGYDLFFPVRDCRIRSGLEMLLSTV